MSLPTPAWLTRAADGIRALADRPLTLFCLLLAINTLGRPCYPTAHDGRLYALQALNASENGAYADDVFLRFGSQDQYSLFSRMAGPLVAEFGIRAVFFFGYFAFNALFILGLFRLVRALIADPLISTLSLVYLVSAALPYGGHDVFTVHEQFFTPRLIGVTFTLFALERTLTRHFVQAAVLLLAGAAFHPLMAFGGIMIWAGYLACTALPTRAFVALLTAGLIAIVAVLSIPSLGLQLFGALDDIWHQRIRIAVGYNYPDTWTFKDWLNLGVCFATIVAAGVTLYRDDSERRRFLAIVTLASAVGFIVTFAAAFLPYALLFQGQPYRVLWILKVLQVPLGFMLIARWADAPLGRFAALGLIAFYSVINYLPPELAILAGAVALSVGIGRMQEVNWWYAAARGFVLGNLAWMAYRCWFMFAQRETIANEFDINEWTMFDMISPMFWLVGLSIALARIEFPTIPWRVVAGATAIVAIAVPATLFAMDSSPTYRREHTRFGADAEFVHDFIHQKQHEGRRPAIYWCTIRPDMIWNDVQATSYFSIPQTAGVMFNRRTAEEVDRRAALVGKFEMARSRGMQKFLEAHQKSGLENLFLVPFDCAEPTEADLRELCKQPGLDYVVIEQEFPGLYSASNGRLFVYECYKIRTEPTACGVACGD